MSNTALITGASGGIGLELAASMLQRVTTLYWLPAIWSFLKKLKSELEKNHGISVTSSGKIFHCLVLHRKFTTKSKSKTYHRFPDQQCRFRRFRACFMKTDWNKEMQMINLNITTLTHLTKLFLQDMVKRGSGKIMNLASTASFQTRSADGSLFCNQRLMSCTFPKPSEKKSATKA